MTTNEVILGNKHTNQCSEYTTVHVSYALLEDSSRLHSRI